MAPALRGRSGGGVLYWAALRARLGAGQRGAAADGRVSSA